MITVSNISKQYESVKALTNISFSINDNEIFGLIGPDGAGKTTFMRLLTTMLLPDNGLIEANGFNTVSDYKKVRNIIGYMPGRFSLYQDLTVEENLNFFASVFNTTIEQNYDLIANIYKQIEPFKNRVAGKLSGGMKQKLALSCALIHKPEILVLDEPTTGVDAVSRMEFWQMLKRLKMKGITIIVSTPYMDEASLCDRVALIQNGQILKIDTPENIIKSYPKYLIAVNAKNKYKLIHDLRKYKNSSSVFAFGSSVHVTFKNNNTDIDELKNFLISEGNVEIDINIAQPDIEDCFMELMKAEKNE